MDVKQELINELSKLYALQREGKKVKVLIQEYESKLFELCDEEMDAERANVKIPKNGKER